MVGIYIISLIVMLCVNACAASKMQEIAEQKGTKERYWAWCFWVPIAGYAMVIALPDRSQMKISDSRKNSGDKFVYRTNTSKYLLDDDMDFDELPEL